MRMFIIMVFATNIFCAGIGALSTSEQETTLNSTPLKRSLAATTTKKSLRMQKADDANGFGSNGDMHDEERVNLQGLSALAILDKETWALSKIFKNADYRIWAKQMISPENVFTTEFHIRVAREAINKNKKVVQWFRYINEYRSRWGDQAFADYQIYQTLKTTKASETKLALLFQSLDDIDDVKNLAAIMKNYQYQKWKEGGEIPNTVAMKLGILNLKPPEIGFDPRFKILDEFTKVAKGENGQKLKRSQSLS